MGVVFVGPKVVRVMKHREIAKFRDLFLLDLKGTLRNPVPRP